MIEKSGRNNFLKAELKIAKIINVQNFGNKFYGNFYVEITLSLTLVRCFFCEFLNPFLNWILLIELLI